MTFPTPEEWQAAVDAGFRSNGATCSPDTIYGVAITNLVEHGEDGETMYPPLPADLHDYRFWTGGAEEDFHAANHEFLTSLVNHVIPQSWWFLKPLARHRCTAYFRAVELVGWNFWREK